METNNPQYPESNNLKEQRLNQTIIQVQQSTPIEWNVSAQSAKKPVRSSLANRGNSSAPLLKLPSISEDSSTLTDQPISQQTSCRRLLSTYNNNIVRTASFQGYSTAINRCQSKECFRIFMTFMGALIVIGTFILYDVFNSKTSNKSSFTPSSASPLSLTTLNIND